MNGFFACNLLESKEKVRNDELGLNIYFLYFEYCNGTFYGSVNNIFMAHSHAIKVK